MQLKRFRSLVTAPGPFASVYFDDSRDTADAVELLQARWRDIRARLERLGADEDAVATLERAVLQHKPPVGRRGRAVIASDDQILVNESLASPPPSTVVRWSDYPYLLPLASLEMWRPTYVFAAIDHAGADISLHEGDIVKSETVSGGGYPVHKPVTAGWSGYGDFQRTTEEAVRMNVRAVVDRLTHLVDQTGAEAVFVCGEVSARAAVVSALPDRVAARAFQLQAGARTSRVDDNHIRDVIETEFAWRRAAEISGIAERFAAQTGRNSGLAVEGLAPVCAALRAGDVDTLIVGRVGNTTVVTGKSRVTVAADADALSELGEPVYRVARADEALPFAAIAVGAALVPATRRLTRYDSRPEQKRVDDDGQESRQTHKPRWVAIVRVV
jgi:hypothetical protein